MAPVTVVPMVTITIPSGAVRIHVTIVVVTLEIILVVGDIAMATTREDVTVMVLSVSVVRH